MRKKPKSIAGKFNPEEVEAIDKILAETFDEKTGRRYSYNKLIREAVAFWMKNMDITYHPTLTEKKKLGRRPSPKRKRGKPKR